jgi:hypothetical protein
VDPNYQGWGSTVATSTTGGTASYNLVKTSTSKRWFEGEFSLFYPLKFDPESYLSRLDVLVNTKLTPRTLWELAPWSWLVDWNLRIGDTIKANELAANDNLIMHYGYAMEKTVYTTGLSWHQTSSPNVSGRIWNNFPNRGGYFATTTYKRRLRANPYGFQAGGQSALTGHQLGILGALGLTKLK